MPNERQTDFIVAEYLKNAAIDFFPNGSRVDEIQNALKTASKRGTDKQGFPEFTAVVNDFVIVIEDKADSNFQANYLDADKKFLLTDTKSIINYAENGALFYAWKIIQNSTFKKVFAFGCSGTDKKKILIRPIFVNPNGYKIMPYEKDFSNFSVEKIRRYNTEKVYEKKPVEQVEFEKIISRSKQLNEDLRNYGQLRDTEKPLVVSGILLALKDDEFDTEHLIHEEKEKSDGNKIWNAISNTLKNIKVEPDVKKSRLLDQFDFIKNRPYLSQFTEKLGKSPLRYFSEYVDSNVITAIVNNSPEDILGRFYSEFISYSGGDGQSLGIVLTPRHIAELFCDLADVKPTDKVFDPCCGTAAFLIAAMNKMLQAAKTDAEKIFIKKNQLHGIELRDDMFSIATTNMILRGDGKSNLLCDDFLKIDAKELREKNFTVGFMNPPYSQAKNKATAHLSELKFVSHLLDSLGDNARCVVIVPQSAMVGKTKEDKEEKDYILRNHTLEGVITLNPQTFYGVGTNPVIAVFTAHKPHDPEHWVKFVDFKNDGYEVFPHLGLLATPVAPERKKLLLQCWHEGRPAPNSFIIRTQIKADDEWLHSFYYFNEEIPAAKDFEKTMADYLTFEFNMIVHGRGYLFDNEKKNSSITADLPSLNSKTWKPFLLKNLFTFDAGKCSQSNRLQKMENGIPYIAATNRNNGVADFVKPVEKFISKGNALAFVCDGEGSMGYSFYKFENSIATSNIIFGYSPNINKYTASFMSTVADKVRGKYSYNYKRRFLRLQRETLMLPVDEKGEPDYFYMENFMRRIEKNLLKLYRDYINRRLDNEVIVPADKKVWKAFLIKDLFKTLKKSSQVPTGAYVKKENLSFGKTPRITVTSQNNGIYDFYFSSDENYRTHKNFISVSFLGDCFFHEYAASLDMKVHSLKLLNFELNKYVAMFLIQTLKQMTTSFNYGDQLSSTDIVNKKIMLPVDESSEPDWEYMEKYMRRQENLLLRKYFLLQ